MAHPLDPLRKLLDAKIAAMTPEERAELRESAQKLATMTPEERAVYLAEVRREALAKYEQRQAQSRRKSRAKRKAAPPTATEGSSPPESQSMNNVMGASRNLKLSPKRKKPMTTSTMIKPATTNHLSALATLHSDIRAVAAGLEHLPMDRSNEAIDFVNDAISKSILAEIKFWGADNFLEHAEQLFSTCRVPQFRDEPDFSALKIAAEKASACLEAIVALEQVGGFAGTLPELAGKALEELVLVSAGCLGRGGDYIWVAEQLID